MAPIPAPIEPLSDGVISLRLYAERDIPEILIAYQDDPQLHLSVGLDRPPSGAQLGTQAENAEAERDAGRQVRLAILEAGSDICRGRIQADHFDWDHLRAELGMWLAPQARGHGYAARVLRLASGWLLDACRLARLALLTDPDNVAMLRAAHTAGFVKEGTLRAYRREQGRRRDMVVLSRLPSDLERA